MFFVDERARYVGGSACIAVGAKPLQRATKGAGELHTRGARPRGQGVTTIYSVNRLAEEPNQSVLQQRLALFVVSARREEEQ